jgi:hypothetical protein
MKIAKPPSRNKGKEYSLQVFIEGLQPKGLLSWPGSPCNGLINVIKVWG